jgi:hypothetical protein
MGNPRLRASAIGMNSPMAPLSTSASIGSIAQLAEAGTVMTGSFALFPLRELSFGANS